MLLACYFAEICLNLFPHCYFYHVCQQSHGHSTLEYVKVTLVARKIGYVRKISHQLWKSQWANTLHAYIFLNCLYLVVVT